MPAALFGVAGCQFPDAPGQRQRFSRPMVAGQAGCPQGEWAFTWQPLTCDESLRVPAWLRAVADRAGDHSSPPLAARAARAAPGAAAD